MNQSIELSKGIYKLSFMRDTKHRNYFHTPIKFFQWGEIKNVAWRGWSLCNIFTSLFTDMNVLRGISRAFPFVMLTF